MMTMEPKSDLINIWSINITDHGYYCSDSHGSVMN